MAKKLIKYGKFLMSMALIFCLIVPSYASLSASDGSAFVTKGEFDSVLSDFNARLTTFEAGINSKIDSQVTSYLERNGIWSGAKQTVTANISTSFTAPTISLNTGSSGKWGPWVYITKTTKPGMMVFNWSWKNTTGNNSNTTRWGWTYVMQGTGYAKADCGFAMYIKFYETKNGITTDKYFDTFAQAMGDSKDMHNRELKQGIMAVSLSTVDIINPVQFFVQKDATIYWEVDYLAHVYYAESVGAMTEIDGKLQINLDTAPMIY